MELYCIEHESMVKAQTAETGYVHEFRVKTDFGFAIIEDVEFCCFEQGWATTPPPEFVERIPVMDSEGYTQTWREYSLHMSNADFKEMQSDLESENRAEEYLQESFNG